MLRDTGRAPARVDVESPPSRRGSTSRRERPPADVRREVAALCRAVARDFGFEFSVSGTHASGPTYDELIGYLAASGRPFTIDTKRLHDHVRVKLLERFEDAKKVPTARELRVAIGEAVIEWIVARFEGLARDTRRTPRKASTVAQYARDGYGGTPLGQRTGELRVAIEDRGKVTVTLPGA